MTRANEDNKHDLYFFRSSTTGGIDIFATGVDDACTSAHVAQNAITKAVWTMSAKKVNCSKEIEILDSNKTKNIDKVLEKTQNILDADGISK